MIARTFWSTVLLCAGAAAAAAQGSSGVAGTWNATWDQALRVRGAEVLEVQRRGSATLTLAARGDSVFGTWVFPVGNGESRDSLSGTFRGDTLQLSGKPRTVIEGGTPLQVSLSIGGVLRNGGLAGVMLMRINDREPAPRRWEAVRPPR